MVKNPINKNRRKAFTLVELMIASICLTIIIGPLFVLLRSGTNSSLKGMMRIETTIKARTILQQIYADLKMATFPVKDGSTYSFFDIMEKGGVFPYVNYSFNSFPIHESYEDIFESPETNINYRHSSRITYRVEEGDNPDLPFKKLIREENFEGKVTQKVLSDNINFFEIKEILLELDGKDQHFYHITLQLVDVLHAEDLNGKNVGDKLRETQKDVVLADFYDVVYPEFFHAFWNDRKANPNWHTLQAGSD